MNIVIAPDSFKGSLTSIQVINIMKKAIKSAKSKLYCNRETYG